MKDQRRERMEEMTVGKFREIITHINRIFKDNYAVILQDTNGKELKLSKIIINDPSGNREDLRFIFSRIN